MFICSRAVGQFWAEMTRIIVESPILPLNVATFANQILHVYLPSLKSDVENLDDKIPEASLAFQQVGFLLVDAKVTPFTIINIFSSIEMVFLYYYIYLDLALRLDRKPLPVQN